MLRATSLRISTCRLAVRSLSSSGAPHSSSSSSSKMNEAERAAYLRSANDTMQSYHEARNLMRAGKLKSKNAHRGPQPASTVQLAIVGVFVVAFLSTPLLGKKIATDEAFRERWVPSWYDFTVRKPENPWTREELHEQMLAVQKDLRERAIQGDFTPEKLAELQRSLQGMDYPHRKGMDMSKVPKNWDRIHPGLEEGESVNDD